ncbi:MAG: cupin domain-containing protein [Saprospiraceae bacterium]|nr:cupin domain-containing protein [Saprospiraceae bacterium]
MEYKLPLTIESGQGEKIIFKEIIKESDGDIVHLEGYCTPNAGPAMHVHYLQDEGFKIVKGSVACQIMGQEPVIYTAGQSVTFYRTIPHRFWNIGDNELIIDGWIKPANSIIFFLDTLYAAHRKSGTNKPEIFDAAYLLIKYRREYGMPEMPAFVKKILLPIIYTLGILFGKYKKFKNATKPL